MTCEFCQIGQHAVEDCNLLKAMTGVRFDFKTRQVMWHLCSKHDFWSTNSHGKCDYCQAEATKTP